MSPARGPTKEGVTMEQKPLPKRKPDPARMQALRNLSIEIKQSLSREESDAFLYEDIWPDSLLEKLKDYLVEGKDG
jgi:hypothetical protein